jgi:hypothetical protein
MHWASKIRAHFHQRLVLLALAMGLVACGAATPAVLPSLIPIHTPLSTPTPLFLLPTPPPKTVQPVTDLSRRWLYRRSCAPPCWEGITPGKISVMAAVEILNRHPFVTQIDFGSIPSEEDGLLIWKWMGSEHGGGILKFPQHIESPMVAWMAISFPDKTYRLSDIIAVYGEPSYVVPSFVDTNTAHFGRTIYYDLRLIYLTQGFYLETERDLFAPPQIAPGMEVAARVTFFPPTIAGLDEVLKSCTGCGVWTSANLLPWQGFQDFATYCQQAHPPADLDFGEMCGRKP